GGRGDNAQTQLDLPARQGWPPAGLRCYEEVPGGSSLARSDPLLRILPRRQRGRHRSEPPDGVDGGDSTGHALVRDHDFRPGPGAGQGRGRRRDRQGGTERQARPGSTRPGALSKEDLMSQSSTRIEHDLLGDLAVPADAYYGVQTARALENFHISGVELRLYP